MMWEPTEAHIAKVLSHARRSLPHECCGVIRGDDYIEITNIAPAPDTFLMHGRELVEVLKRGAIDAVAHSHVFLPPLASEVDRSSCEASGVPWLIVSTPNNTHAVIRPSGFRAPLVGREFAWGVHDCFALVRDGFADYSGIVIPNIHREWEFWRRDDDFIRASMPRMGFVELPPDTPPQHLDVFGMKVHGRVVNHLGLYLEPGRILHHMTGRLSQVETYGGTYQQLTELHARHLKLMEGTSGR